MMLDEDEKTRGMHRMRPAHLLQLRLRLLESCLRARSSRPRVGDTDEHIEGEAKKEGRGRTAKGGGEERKDARDREKRRNSN